MCIFKRMMLCPQSTDREKYFYGLMCAMKFAGKDLNKKLGKFIFRELKDVFDMDYGRVK